MSATEIKNNHLAYAGVDETKQALWIGTKQEWEAMQKELDEYETYGRWGRNNEEWDEGSSDHDW